MPVTLRLRGSLTAETPIMITRPDQGETVLTMTVIRGDIPKNTGTLPGETIKGLLRSTMFAIATEAAQQLDPAVGVTLSKLYEQTGGGLEFTSEARELGAQEQLRVRHPILSLMGSANPKLTGRLIIDPATANQTTGGDGAIDYGLVGGVRQDPAMTNPENAALLSDEDRQKWAAQAVLVGQASAAKNRLKDAQRAVRRAAATEGVDVKPFREEEEAAKVALAKIEGHPDYKRAIQRPVPKKFAAPIGTVYAHGYELRGATLIETGLFLAALDSWAFNPRIGGGRTVGFGRLRGHYQVEALVGDTLRTRKWESIGEVVFDGAGPAVRSAHPIVLNAIKAWDEAAANIIEGFDIFDRRSVA